MEATTKTEKEHKNSDAMLAKRITQHWQTPCLLFQKEYSIINCGKSFELFTQNWAIYTVTFTSKDCWEDWW